MTPVVLDIGGQGPQLCFAHANGYPPGAYRQLFELLKPHFSIAALELRPLWGGRTPPRRLTWQLFADDMIAVLADRYEAPVWLLGHSLGAVTAALAAARAPERIAGLILLDPVFLPPKLVLMSRMLPIRQRRKIPMVRRALGRPEHFESFEAAFSFYRGKRAFQGLDDEALRDYVESSKALEADGRVRLRYSPEWEAAVYASPPLVKRTLRSLEVETIGLHGRESDVLGRDMVARWRHWQPSARLREAPGGHLFPLERPRETAELVVREVFRQ